MDQSHVVGLACGTGVDWDSFSRENREKIGGEGKVVQIDESRFGKQKYHWRPRKLQ